MQLITSQKKQNNLRKSKLFKFKPKIANKNQIQQRAPRPSPKVEDKKSASSIQIEVDSEKLTKLLNCLEKSKGVDKTQIDENIVARTVEFGQEKIAQQLNIPYRRYKSILNKCQIKTTAGRKVNNLKLENDLVEWALKIKDAGVILTRKMIRDKATKLYHEDSTSTKKVNLSKGWLDKFVKRHEDIKEYLTSQKGKKGL